MTDSPPPGRIVLTTAIVAVIGVLYAVFWLPTPIVFDENLALPIARAVADSTLYPAKDLLIDAGLRGPFHLYRAAGRLYTAGIDVDLAWYGGLLLSIAALGASVVWLARAMRVPPAAAALAGVLVCVAPFYRGTINWSGMPLFWFVSSSFAVPLAVSSVAAAFAGRTFVSAAAAGAAFLLHPGAGVVAGAVAVAIVIAGASATAESPVRLALQWTLVAALVAAPNVYYIATHAGANFTAGAEARDEFWTVFRSFAYHVYPRDHWRDGYPWFALSLFALALTGREFEPAIRRRVVAAIIAASVTIGVYALGVAVVRSPAIALMFLGRVSWLIKPIAFVAVSAAIYRAWAGGAAKRPVVVLAGLFWLGAVLHRSPGIGEALFALFLAAWFAREAKVVGVVIGLGLAALGFAIAWYARGGATSETLDSLRLASIGVGIAGAIAAIAMPIRTEVSAAPVESKPGALLAWAFVPMLLAIVAGGRSSSALMPRSIAAIDSAVHFSRPRGDIGQLAGWASTISPPGSLFLVPPDDPRFVPFRLHAQRGVYIHLADIPQLAYDLTVYAAGYRRLLEVGAIVLGPHNISANEYGRLDAPQLRALAEKGVTHAVFAADRAELPEFQVAWRDDRWVVYGLDGASSRKTQ